MILTKTVSADHQEVKELLLQELRLRLDIEINGVSIEPDDVKRQIQRSRVLQYQNEYRDLGQIHLASDLPR